MVLSMPAFTRPPGTHVATIVPFFFHCSLLLRNIFQADRDKFLFQIYRHISS